MGGEWGEMWMHEDAKKLNTANSASEGVRRGSDAILTRSGARWAVIRSAASTWRAIGGAAASPLPDDRDP